ncbi:group XV phospholipase A2 [Alligator sinensis]|uniref:Group XV phospholipase A2 n=1 Tax=Alligator sinensis TaxID=38654 RepID=A0A3Q0G7X3_ALLSI|nr:group XV phospholipase A2 [Alligator sinensis]
MEEKKLEQTVQEQDPQRDNNYNKKKEDDSDEVGESGKSNKEETARADLRRIVDYSAVRRLVDGEFHTFLIVPGDLGNQLEAKLDKPTVVHYLCSKKTESYFTLWLNLELLLPVIIDCWIDNIRLIYNRTNKITEPPDGVDVRVPGFGQTFALEFLDPSKRNVGTYFYTLVQSLVDWGYQRDEDVRGAPYDWRKAPNENGDYFVALRKMIESMYEQYGSPVVLIAHSMGNMYTLYFLNHQTQEWKDKHIKDYVSLGAPWGGVAKTLRVLASGSYMNHLLPRESNKKYIQYHRKTSASGALIGHTHMEDARSNGSDNNRIPVISPLKIRDQQRSAVSTNWMLPYNYTWPPDKIFVSTPTANYTIQDYQKFYKDINFEDGWLMRRDTEPLVYQMIPPGVRIHCLYGTGVETPDSFYYDMFPDKEPKIVYSDGDGTVNLQSAIQCQKWVGMQEEEVLLFELSGNEHIEMLSNVTTISYVKRLLFGL